MTLRYLPDDNARMLGVRSGEIHVAEAVPFGQIDQMSETPGAEMLLERAYAVNNISLNHAREPLDDVKIRQALNYAVPREQIADSVFGGRVELASGILPKTETWSSEVEPYPHDVEEAKTLVQESKYPDGASLTLAYPSGDATARQMGLLLQEAWNEIGIRTQLESRDIGTLYEQFLGGNVDSAYLTPDTSDIPVDDLLAPIFQDYTAGFDVVGSNYKSDKAVKLLDEALTAADEGRRDELFGQLQQLSLDDAQKVALFYLPTRTAVRDSVRNFRTLPTGWWRLEQVYLDE